MDSNSPIQDLPSELCQVIISHLPVHATPFTALSIALTNRWMCNRFLSFIHTFVIVWDQNWRSTLALFQRFIDFPEIGRTVRLVQVQLSTVSHGDVQTAFGAVEKAIRAGSLPMLHTLGLNVFSLETFGSLARLKRFTLEFWKTVLSLCPQLRTITLKGLACRQLANQLVWSKLLKSKGQILNSLTFHHDLFRLVSRNERTDLFKSIGYISHQLRTLDLALSAYNPLQTFPLEHPYSELFSFTFPRLETFALWNGTNIQSSMLQSLQQELTLFLTRHPSLNFLRLALNIEKTAILTNGDESLPSGFLPLLKHLGGNFFTCRALAQLLPQLTALVVYESYNAQVPYLLRSVVPGGVLPNLRSLAIAQEPQKHNSRNREEGCLWHETKDGEIKNLSSRKARQTILDNIHALARGAPYLEELGFTSSRVTLPDLANKASEFSEFRRLERLFFRGNQLLKDEMSPGEREAVMHDVQALAECCTTLTDVVNYRRSTAPFMGAHIGRSGGDLATIDVKLKDTFVGRHVGCENEAFTFDRFFSYDRE
ncbi:hypothetical protein FA15DRAFT_693313 [Coprinopsis marcescibilis]|uniref:Uncharacterized protein n=1 Tax=Coprinopsis marcescibilis TaxID=230819 RepID=A0A5C3KZW4_COPMA|nr:hypothetical protein FA15DRAFT_693313 [Coprinopsis marcescibilis]